MATMTTSWKTYAKKTWTGSAGTEITFYLDAKYTKQSVANNNTTGVYTRLRSTVDVGSASGSGYTFTCTYCEKITGTGVWNFDDETIMTSPSKTITHTTDGSKSLSLSATAKNTYLGINISLSATVDLPKIDRLATVTSSSDFNDEENPTLSFDNPAGFTVYPYLNFYDNDNNLVHQLIRNSESATSPYTWNITEEERTALWKATNKQQSYKVSVGVETYNGTTKLGYNSKAQTMTYVNAEPTYTYTIVDENTKVTGLLGESAEYLVQNVSQPKITIDPTAKKEATISNVALSYNGVGSILQSEPYEKSYIANSTDFLVRVYDSRLFYVGQDTITRNIIEYLTVNIDSFLFKRENPTSSNIILNAQIRYKQATFGSTDNVPTIKWKLGAEGELNTLTTEDYTIDEENNRITISNLVLSDVLPYTSEGRFYLYVNDLLTEDTENDIVIKGIPTCDMGEHDFKVNGELYVADTEGKNKKEIRDLFFPIGSTYITSENVSPASYLGGTWDLVDKEFGSEYDYLENDNSVFPYTNISAGSLRANRGGHTLTLSFYFTLKSALSDTSVVLTTLALSKLGITSAAGSHYVTGYTDAGNSALMLQLHEDGKVEVDDIIPESSVASSNAVSGVFSVVVPFDRMLDDFCDKFYWKRTA